jgi:Carboxypeptidase regulatory-like domain
MYDTISRLFVLSFAAFYLISFAVLVLWIVKPWLPPSFKKHRVAIARRARRLSFLLRQVLSSISKAGRSPIARTPLVMLVVWMLLPALGRAEKPASGAVMHVESSIQGDVTVGSSDGRLTVVPGVTVTLAAVSPKTSAVTGGSNIQNDVRLVQQEKLPAGSRLTVLTNAQGHYAFSQLKAGSYRVLVSAAAFQPFSETIVVAPGELRVANIELQLASVIQTVKVHAQAPGVAQEGASVPARISQRDLYELPLAQQKFTDALPLVPSVVRTPDGQLNMKGASETSGMLLLDSAQLVDPVTGNFAIGVPIDAIQTVSVNETPYNTEYGGFSGGLTTIETKPPSGQWNYDFFDFIPGIRGKNGQIVGIADWTPRLTFGGPLIQNKLNFFESFSYDKRNQPVRGLAWPHDEIQTQGFNSFTNLQAILSPRHLLVMNVDVFPLRTQFADINSLVPQSASSNYGQKGVSVGGTDSFQFNSGALLSTVFRYTRFDSNAYGQGLQNMLITPEGWGGNFFNSWIRTANEFELLPTFQFAQKEWLGRHELKIGADFTQRSYGGTSASRPIDLLRQDGSLAETISFQGQGFLNSQDAEIAEFIQDHWTVNDRLAFELGGRMTSQEEGRSGAFAPRGGVVFSPDQSRKTIIRAGAGLFYDQVPLLATDFNENPSQVITPFGALGFPAAAPEVFRYECAEPGRQMVFTAATCNFGSSPRNFTWNLEIERQLRPNLFLRASYLYSQTQDLPVVNPLQLASQTNPVLGLSPTGGSHYGDFEVTLHYEGGEFSQLNASYIHSQAQGNLNTVASEFVPFEEPVIRPDAVADLNSDVPNRFITWGEFHLPWHLVVAPVADVHTGFPYSNVDVLQNYVGAPNGQRFPAFFSLDARVYREFRLPVPFIHKLQNHRLRFGLYSINMTNHSNPRDVYSNVASPYFGHFVGFQHRVDGLVIDFVK